MISVTFAAISFPVFLMISVVIAFIVFGALLSKNRNLSEELQPGEEAYWELEKVRYSLVHSNSQSSTHPGGRLILTNKRLLVAQKVLLLKQWRMNAIINWGDESEVEEVSLIDMMRAGIWETQLPPSKIRVEQKKGGKWEVSIPLREGGIGPDKITFPLTEPETFKSALERVS